MPNLPATLPILHTIPSLAATAGGTARSVTRLTEHLTQFVQPVHLLTLAATGIPVVAAAPVQTTSAPCRLRLGSYPLWTPDFSATLAHLLRHHAIQLIHDHGCWLPTNWAAFAAARHHHLPFILSPRGMLEPWSLQQSRARKRAVWWLFQARALHHAHVLHATSLAEAANLRRLGLRRPIVVIPNGTDLPSHPLPVRSRLTGSPRTLLFLSRIHPKKGLLNLVAALTTALPPDWQVLIAGHDEGNHQAAVQAAAHAAGLADRITFVGPVDHRRKWDLYAQADLFVLPTFSENFGNVIVEALAAGVPVITTKGAPWQDLVTHDCGWWIEIGVEPLAAALDVAMQLPDEVRRAMGACGQALVHAKYTWEHAAAQMAEVYHWTVGRGDRPPTLVDDTQ